MMKTLDLKRKADNNGANGLPTVQAETAKGGALQPSKSFDDKKSEEPGKKIDPTATNTDKVPKPQAAIQAEEKKEEAIAPIAAKPSLNLEGTLKLVEELHKRKIHRDNLLNTIKTLEEFEVLVQEESEELDHSSFQGCKLTIEDDNRNAFSTKNPALIKAVAEYLNEKCVAKLVEIEADIVIPV